MRIYTEKAPAPKHIKDLTPNNACEAVVSLLLTGKTKPDGTSYRAGG